MKSSLSSLLFLASCSLMGHGASAVFVEPDWWPIIQTSFAGTKLSRCEGLYGVPPPNGSACSAVPKTCYFEDQDCEGLPYPATRCLCNYGIWQCLPQSCPDIPPSPPKPCYDHHVVIDFETEGDGTDLSSGQYVQDEWFMKYGVTVSASSATGYTPNGMPRLFDTSSPGSDPDLGSPNNACDVPGPGVGAGGIPGVQGMNCAPQGLVLIIQEDANTAPDDNAQGGMIIFNFAYPTNVNSIGLMDIEAGGQPTTIAVKRTNGDVIAFDAKGLGDNSVESIALNVWDAVEVKITFSTSGAVTFLDLCVRPPPVCENFVLDFDTAGDGKALPSGRYVKDEWFSEYGITVSAMSSDGGYTPDNKPRLFDTAFPGTEAAGDPDLGSPNNQCPNNPGPGVGVGGEPPNPGENCVPQGLVLIIQEENTSFPDDNQGGGMIIFDFLYPTDINSLGLMDIETGGKPTSITVTRSNHEVFTFTPLSLGDNSVEAIPINIWDVKQLKITFGGSGAVTYLDLCIVRPPKCHKFSLDFEKRGNGMALLGGEYISDEWEAQYGITVSATGNGGYTPDNRPRLFDTTTPGSDPDLGSPNNSCNPPGGPGVGDGGKLNQPGENCDPQGLVLIIQESKKPEPDDNAGGGMIIFDFKFPTEVHSVGLMDIEDGVSTSIFVTRTNHQMVSGFNVQNLGDNSVQDVPVGVLDAKKVKVTFGGSGAITDLELCIRPPPKCHKFQLDFETRGNGTALSGGDYVGTDWEAQYGITVSAMGNGGGHTPNGMPRIFDTTSPGSDPDLGSPNNSCPPPGGPGVGTGGEFDQLGANCDPQGLVLIIQESMKAEPDDYAGGGMIVFEFDNPAEVHSVGLMDIESGVAPTTIEVTRAGGTVVPFNALPLGDNSVQDVAIGILDAKKVKITFGGSGAVTDLDLCVDPVIIHPTNPPTCVDQVVNQVAVCVVMDSSGSINTVEWTQQLNFVSQLIDAIDGATDEFEVALTVFSSTGDEFVQQVITNNPATAKTSLFSINRLAGATDPAPGIDLCTDQLANHATIDNKVMIVLTDGQPNCLGNVDLCRVKAGEASAAAAVLDIDVIAVGVGDAVDDETLDVIATSANLVLRATDFASLENEVINLANTTVAC